MRIQSSVSLFPNRRSVCEADGRHLLEQLDGTARGSQKADKKPSTCKQLIYFSFCTLPKYTFSLSLILPLSCRRVRRSSSSRSDLRQLIPCTNLSSFHRLSIALDLKCITFTQDSVAHNNEHDGAKWSRVISTGDSYYVVSEVSESRWVKHM